MLANTNIPSLRLIITSLQFFLRWNLHRLSQLRSRSLLITLYLQLSSLHLDRMPMSDLRDGVHAREEIIIVLVMLAQSFRVIWWIDVLIIVAAEVEVGSSLDPIDELFVGFSGHRLMHSGHVILKLLFIPLIKRRIHICLWGIFVFCFYGDDGLVALGTQRSYSTIRIVSKLIYLPGLVLLGTVVSLFGEVLADFYSQFRIDIDEALILHIQRAIGPITLFPRNLLFLLILLKIGHEPILIFISLLFGSCSSGIREDPLVRQKIPIGRQSGSRISQAQVFHDLVDVSAFILLWIFITLFALLRILNLLRE